MTLSTSTVDPQEIERFSRIAEEWWDEKGKFKPLHSMNPVRIGYIRDRICLRMKRSAESLKPLEGLRVIDIGCGGGLMAEPMARMGADVTGIDASEKNIEVARLHARNMGLSIDYRCTTAESVSGEEGHFTYDVVLALEIVEHVADVSMFLHSCVGLLKPGGLLFVSTLNRTIESLVTAIIGAEYVLRWLPPGTHQWRKFLRPSELLHSLRMQNVGIDHMTGLLYSPFRKKWYLDEKNLDVNYIIVAVG